MTDHTHTTIRRHRGAALLAGSALCLAAAGGCLAGAITSRDDVAAAHTGLDAIEIIQIRSELRRVHLDETNALMLQVFGAATDADVELARTARIELRDAVEPRLLELSRDGGAPAAEALFLYDLLHDDGQDGVHAADPDVMYDTGRAAARDNRPPDEQTPEDELALYDLMRTDSAGAQVLNDAMDAAYTTTKPDVPTLLEDYVSRSEPYIRSDGGYLGPDPEQPLVDSYIYDQTAQFPHPAVQAVEARIAASRLWEYDQWIRSWQDTDDPGNPPYSIPELVAEVAGVDRDIRETVDTALDSAAVEHTRDLDSAERRQLLFVAGTVLFGLAGAGLLLTNAWRRWREVRTAAERLTLDPLTGVSNRHQLDSEAAVVDTDPDRWHVVAAIDMDRFKLINDTWGHGVGDDVLVEVARRLTDVVASWRRRVPGLTGTVVRMGGDEFLLTLHSPSEIDEALLRSELERIRDDSIGADDQRVTLSFSVGIAGQRGPCALQDLVRTADLAAYEEKAQRAAEPGAAHERTGFAGLGGAADERRALGTPIDS